MVSHMNIKTVQPRSNIQFEQWKLVGERNLQKIFLHCS